MDHHISLQYYIIHQHIWTPKAGPEVGSVYKSAAILSEQPGPTDTRFLKETWCLAGGKSVPQCVIGLREGVCLPESHALAHDGSVRLALNDLQRAC